MQVCTRHSKASLGAVRQTQNVDPMLDQRWASVADGVPTWIQHRVNVSCMMGAVIPLLT